MRRLVSSLDCLSLFFYCERWQLYYNTIITTIYTSDESYSSSPPHCPSRAFSTALFYTCNQVLDIFKNIVALAFNPKDACGDPSDLDISNILKQLRRSSLNTEDQDYFKYLERESFICEHVLDCLDKIREETRGKRSSRQVMDALNLVDLESGLDLNSKRTESWAAVFCKQLGLLVGIRDSVPRSQLTFTLQLVRRNAASILKRRPEKLHPEKTGEQSSEDQDQGEDLNDEASASVKSFDADNIDPSDDDLDDHDSNHSNWEDEDRQRQLSDVDNRLIAAHEHITQYKFNEQSLAMLNRMALRKRYKNDSEWTKSFGDSDDEGDDHTRDGDVARKLRVRKEAPEDSDEEDKDDVLKDATKTKSHGSGEPLIVKYVDDELDVPLQTACDTEHDALFPSEPSEWGFGAPVFSGFAVTSVLAQHVPMYFVQIDVRRLKIKYSDSEGLPIAYIFHKNILRRSLQHPQLAASAPGQSVNVLRRANVKMLAYREELLKWLVDLIRSPLPKEAIYWFLDKLENGATTQSVPSLTAYQGSTAKNSSEEAAIGGDLNLLVIADCIAKALPSPNEARDLFKRAFHVPALVQFLPYITRKNNLYGIHIVRGGTREKLEEYGAVVEVCDLGYDALTRSKDNASMYLSIINKFSTFIWMVYVTGLDHIDDALLKWLAEYTKAHPWRFVYLEKTQTSWNFSENRDRCVYDHAPPPIERGIKSEDDLKRTEIKQLRPTHLQPYPRVAAHCEKLHKKEGQIMDMDWTSLSNHTRNFFSNGMETANATEGVNWSACMQPGADDYREQVKKLMQGNEPCVLLLCSPPGAGKSHFANDLSELVRTDIGLRKAFIDGSDDRLVDMALTEILKVELPDPKISQFLIVDEFHMLKENHKVDFFAWLKVHARRLHVLLIANRKDARDDELLHELRDHSSNIGLSSDRIKSFSTRLGNELLNEVMDKRRTEGREDILRWMHCSRCLFGGEAVSLRGIDKLEESLKKLKSSENSGKPMKDLVNLLLNKVPTVSEATAQEFVTCFRASMGKDPVEAMAAVAQTAKGPVSIMLQASLLTEAIDAFGMDYPDFVANKLERAYDASPALRIAAWCCQMREAAFTKTSDARIAKQMLDRMDSPKPLFGTSFVDQCGFPLQLEVKGKTDLSEGLAFSWGGDYTRMGEIIDAVKHGHSVDWKDVHDLCWQCEPVQDSALLVELLSVCTSPAKVLSALTKENLCALLKVMGMFFRVHVIQRRDTKILCKNFHFGSTSNLCLPSCM